MLPETAAHLWDALEAARAAREFTEGIVYHEFTGDLMRRSAVERQLEVLGEALNRIRRVDSETSQRIPGLAQIVGMRNIIAHDYGSIDCRLVWEAATTRVPDLVAVLALLLDEVSPDPVAE